MPFAVEIVHAGRAVDGRQPVTRRAARSRAAAARRKKARSGAPAEDADHAGRCCKPGLEATTRARALGRISAPAPTAPSACATRAGAALSGAGESRNGLVNRSGARVSSLPGGDGGASRRTQVIGEPTMIGSNSLALTSSSTPARTQTSSRRKNTPSKPMRQPAQVRSSGSSPGPSQAARGLQIRCGQHRVMP